MPMSVRVSFSAHSGLIFLSAIMLSLFIFLITAVAARAAEADDPGRLIFERDCQVCHSIGGGQIVGPDLEGITGLRDRDWLVSFIVSPDQLVAQGDSLARQLVQEYGMTMPDMGVSEQEAAEILIYIEAQSGGVTVSSDAGEEPALAATTVSPGDAANGRDIFTGRVSLGNGGAACISCHNVNGIAALGGGVIAKDLTGTYSNLGEPGLTSILKAVPFPLMKAIYQDRPLEDNEVADLVAFLGESADGEPASGQNLLAFIMIGIAGLLLIIIILQITWRGRLSGVRRTLVKGDS